VVAKERGKLAEMELARARLQAQLDTLTTLG
jgi:hypothetical protein